MNVSFLNMNDECGCLLSFHAHFWYWPLLFHVRESWLPQRGVRRAYHRLFLYKCLSPYICLCLSIVVYLLQDRYGGKYIYRARQIFVLLYIYIYLHIWPAARSWYKLTNHSWSMKSVKILVKKISQNSLSYKTLKYDFGKLLICLIC